MAAGLLFLLDSQAKEVSMLLSTERRLKMKSTGKFTEEEKGDNQQHPLPRHVEGYTEHKH